MDETEQMQPGPSPATIVVTKHGAIGKVPAEHQISVDGGKYTFVLVEGRGGFDLNCLRYGVPWMTFDKGCSAVWSLLFELVQIAEGQTAAPVCTEESA